MAGARRRVEGLPGRPALLAACAVLKASREHEAAGGGGAAGLIVKDTKELTAGAVASAAGLAGQSEGAAGAAIEATLAAMPGR